MQKQLIQSIVDSMLSQYKEYGITESSFETYRDGFCKPIIRYCEEHNEGKYSTDLLATYLKMYKAKLDEGKIRYTYYSIVLRIVRLLQSVAETGTADFSKAKTPRQFNPSQDHLIMINQIIVLNKIPKRSTKQLHSQLCHLFYFVEQHGVSDKDITDEIFFKFIESVSETSKGNMSEVMRAVRLTSAYMKNNGATKLRTDFSLLPYKRATVRMIPPYLQEEIKRIVDIIDTSTAIGKRDYAIMLLAFDTGLRGIDIITLRLQDINWRTKTLSIRQNKTGHPITQVLHDAVLNAMADYILEGRPNNGEKEIFLSSRPPHKALCDSSALSSCMEKYEKLACVEKKPKRSFYSVRRTFATELSLKGTPLGEITELLGHRSSRSDKPYLSYNRKQISFVACDFSEIPITGGIYANAFLSSKRGEENEFS